VVHHIRYALTLEEAHQIIQEHMAVVAELQGKSVG